MTPVAAPHTAGDTTTNPYTGVQSVTRLKRQHQDQVMHHQLEIINIGESVCMSDGHSRLWTYEPHSMSDDPSLCPPFPSHHLRSSWASFPPCSEALLSRLCEAKLIYPECPKFHTNWFYPFHWLSLGTTSVESSAGSSTDNTSVFDTKWVQEGVELKVLELPVSVTGVGLWVWGGLSDCVGLGLWVRMGEWVGLGDWLRLGLWVRLGDWVLLWLGLVDWGDSGEVPPNLIVAAAIEANAGGPYGDWSPMEGRENVSGRGILGLQLLQTSGSGNRSSYLGGESEIVEYFGGGGVRDGRSSSGVDGTANVYIVNTSPCRDKSGESVMPRDNCGPCCCCCCCCWRLDCEGTITGVAPLEMMIWSSWGSLRRMQESL